VGRAWIAVAWLAGCNQILQIDPITATAACPAGYHAIPGAPPNSRYRYSIGGSWADSEAACEADGAHLVVFDDLSELQAVAASLDFAGYWRDAGSDPLQYHAVTGEVIDASSPMWGPNEPTIWNGSNVTLVGDDLLLLAVPGDRPYAALCECDGRSVTSLPQP
jgi:hypothetical protein